MVEPSENKGLKRIWDAIFYSIQGVIACYKTEESFRQELWLAVIFLPLGAWLGDGSVEKLLLAGSVFLVLIIELLNSAIERAIDRISFERHKLSKDAKDMGSAAIFLSIVMCVVTWVVILF